MRILSLCVLITLNLCAVWANDVGKVHSISFSGNKWFNEQDILKIMTLKPYSEFSQAKLLKDIDAISKLYQENGFYFVEVNTDPIPDSLSNSEVDIKINIKENDRVIIDSIYIFGNTILTNEEIIQQFDTSPGKILVPSVLENDFYNLINTYERIGYPFASVSLQEVRLKKDDELSKMNLDIMIDEGKRVTIDEVKVVGNKLTKNNVIIRETRLKIGEVYNIEKIKKIPNRLKRLNIFSRVEEPILYSTTTHNGLWIRIEEGNTSTFDGVIGYSPGKADEKGVVTGMVNVSMRNLFGTARKLNLKWLRDEINSQEIGIHYLEPWIFNYPFNLGGGFEQRKQDTLYVKRIFNLTVDLLLTEELTLSGSLNKMDIIPSINANIIYNSHEILYGGDIHYDSRNEVVNTTSGINYRTGYQVGKKNSSYKSSTVQRISIDLDYYQLVFPKQVLMIGFHGRNLSSNNIELGDLYRFGGTNSLRGYRENQFLASRLYWSNTEYRLLIQRRSYVFGFFDTGYYYLPGDESKKISSTQKFKYGYGIGVRLETVLGNLGVSLAFGEGDSFLEGKIHVGLINEF